MISWKSRTREIHKCINTEKENTVLPSLFTHPLLHFKQGILQWEFLQTRTLEWVAILFSREFPWPRDWTWVSCISGRFCTIWAFREARYVFSSVQFSSVAQSCLTLCDPVDHSTPGFPVHHQLPEFTQTHVLRVSDTIQPSHPLSSPSPPASNPSQHQSLFQWVNSLHEVAKVLEFQH